MDRFLDRFRRLFFWMITCIIVDCWLKRQFIKSFIVSARMPEEIRLSFAAYVFSLGALVVTGDWMRVCVVTLLALRFSSSVSAMTVLIACQSFSFENGVFVQSLCSIIVYNISVYHSSSWVAMQAHSYAMSSLFKIFLPHSNMLKQLSTSSVTEYSSYYVSLFAFFVCLYFCECILIRLPP